MLNLPAWTDVRSDRASLRIQTACNTDAERASEDKTGSFALLPPSLLDHTAIGRGKERRRRQHRGVRPSGIALGRALRLARAGLMRHTL